MRNVILSASWARDVETEKQPWNGVCWIQTAAYCACTPKKGSWVGHSRPTCSHYQILPWLHSQVWCYLDLSLETGSIFRVEMACVCWRMAFWQKKPQLPWKCWPLHWPHHETLSSTSTARAASTSGLIATPGNLLLHMKCPGSLQGCSLRLVAPWGFRTANGQLDSGQGSVPGSLGRTELRSLLLRKNSQTQWRLDKNSGFDYQIMGLMGGKQTETFWIFKEFGSAQETQAWLI